MPPERYTPTQTARHASVSPNTVRSWTKEYREFLSEHANPPAGVDRSFTASDVAVIQAIAQLRANNLSHEDVKERLRQQPPEPLQETQDSPSEAASAPDVANALVPASDAVQAFLAHAAGKLDDVATKVGDVDRRLERVESQRMLIWVALGGIAVGAVVVTAIVLIVLASQR